MQLVDVLQLIDLDDLADRDAIRVNHRNVSPCSTL